MTAPLANPGPIGGRHDRGEANWPTEARRPWESVSDWCRRLDSYVNPPTLASEVPS